jgi:hypothetical protein
MSGTRVLSLGPAAAFEVGARRGRTIAAVRDGGKRRDPTQRRVHPFAPGWPMDTARLLCALALAAPLAACIEPAGIVLGASAAAVPVIGRTLPDAAVSVLSGQDCSLVRLDAGKSYCAPQEPPPAAPVVCTRSLGTVDCWSNPQALAVPYAGVADGPRALTPAQEAHRTRRWPSLW